MDDIQRARQVEPVRKVVQLLSRYHRHEVVGLENVPATGGVLLVVNHSLATYDGAMLGNAIYEHNGRLPTALGDDLIFAMPRLADAASAIGIHPASPHNGEQLLREGHMVYLAPGGMREALRPSSERYQIRWARRRGFVRLALQAQAPIVLAACPRADDLYTVYENPLTKMAYKSLRVPVPLVRGLGPTWIPRPVQLTHHIAPPIHPPSRDSTREREQVEELHARVARTMERLLARGSAGETTPTLHGSTTADRP